MTVDIEYALNADLECFESYCVMNVLLLILKAGKTESMLFGSSQRLLKHGRDTNIVYKNPINFVKGACLFGKPFRQPRVIDEKPFIQKDMRMSAFAIIRNRSAVKSVKEIFDKQVLSLVLKCLRHEFDHNVLGQYFDSQNYNKHTRNNKFIEIASNKT